MAGCATFGGRGLHAVSKEIGSWLPSWCPNLGESQGKPPSIFGCWGFCLIQKIEGRAWGLFINLSIFQILQILFRLYEILFKVSTTF
jgi:hypothetical protein